MNRFATSAAILALALSAASPVLASTSPNLPCTQQAIATRETALVNAFTTYSSAIQSAYVTRQGSLQSAWTIQDKDTRQNAIQNVWKSFKASTKTAKLNVRNARRTAWKNFKDAAKSCNATSTDPGGGESADTSI